MLETIRDYAREKLAAGRRAGGRPPRAIASTISRSPRRRSDGMRGAEQANWIARIETELDNVRAAIALAMGGRRGPDHRGQVRGRDARLLDSARLRDRRAASAVAQRWRLPAVRESDLAQGHALYVGAALAHSQSDYAEARAMLEQCLTLRRRLGNEIDIAATLSTLAVTCLATATSTLPSSARRKRWRSSSSTITASARPSCCCNWGRSACGSGDDAQAREYIADCAALARQLGHREAEAECELVIGELDFESGAPARARERFTRSLTICRGAADKRGEANALWWLAKVDLEDGDFADCPHATWRSVAGVLGLRDARGTARLPGGPRAPGADSGRDRSRSPARRRSSDVAPASQPDPVTARRAALEGATRFAARGRNEHRRSTWRGAKDRPGRSTMQVRMALSTQGEQHTA